MLSIAEETPRQDEVARLLAASDAFSAALYPPESNHMIDVEALCMPGVRFFVARDDGRAVGCGALVPAGDGTAEVKRMFVDPAARGRGVGLAILEAVEAAGRDAALRVIRLETGVNSREALSLYRRCGYRERGPFGAYRPDPLSVFMEKSLASG